MDKIPVKNASLVRDIKSRAILSTDIEAKRAYEKKRDFYASVRGLIDRVNRLEECLNTQAGLIQELLNRK